MHHNKPMYITNIEKEGPFLKIWGQIDKKSCLEVEEALHQASVLFEEGKHTLKPNCFEVGVLCCAKYMDDKYYRARITSIALLSDGLVEVYFLDYGNKDTVPMVNLRSPECFNSSFISLPPLSSPFILAEAVCAGGEWNDLVVEQISREIRYIEAQYAIVAQATRFYLAKVFIHETDLGVHLIRQNLMQHTSIQTQEAVLLAMIPRAAPQPVAPPNQSLLQYKSYTLEPNSRHEVYVSYVTDGPCHFSVQLKRYESALAQLMKEINSISLKPLDELPNPGTVCLAKCVEDNHICRAVVTSEVDSLYKLFYVDFGNTELVPPENLYQMSFKYIIPKIMAIRLSLDGIEKSTMTIEMQCAFKQFVDNRVLMMEVLPAPKKMALPKCRMWDPDTNLDVIEVLNRAAKFAYPDPLALHKGFTQLVKVSFVYSCNRFFIQLVSKEPELNKVMVDLQAYCISNQTPYLNKARVGQPCCALFSFDKQWYRSEITEVKGDVAKVRYIDYGNEEDVPIKTLKVIEGEYLTILRPQAIECCLNGYQNMGVDPNLDHQLEELILEQEFTMRVIDTINNKTLVDLTDASGATVSALLLETFMTQGKKSVTPTVDKRFDFGKGPSPADNEEEHVSRSYYQHDDRRPPRSQSRKDRNDDKSTWRQNSRKRSDSNSNESTESWRQENRGFRGRKENDWNERSGGDNSRKERGFRDNKENFSGKERQPRSRDQNGEWGAKEDGERDWNKTQTDRDSNSGDTWKQKPQRNQNDDYASREDSRGFKKPRSQNGEWEPKEDNWNQNKQPRNKNEEWGSKEKSWDQNKPPRTRNDDYGSKENSWDQNKPPRNKNEDRGSKENTWDQNKQSKNKSDDWGSRDDRKDNRPPRRRDDRENSDWNGGANSGGHKNRNNYNNDDWSNKNSEGGEKRGYKSRNNDGDEWGSNKGDSERNFGDRSRGNDRDFRKKPFRREGSEAASSGSEKSYGKGFRTSSRNDTRAPRYEKKFENKSNDNSWNVSQVPSVIDSAPNDAEYNTIDVIGHQEKVTISWFHNPCSFFCQLVETQESFKALMQDIQESYKSRPAGSCVVGAPAIALFPEDNVLYRAKILEVIGGQYKVHYVDFGNVSVVNKVWPIENKFMNLEIQAIPCGLGGIEPLEDGWPNPDNFSKYFEREYLDCNFLVNEEDGRYLVTLTANDEDVSQQLVSDGLAKYSEPETACYDMNIFVNQQFHGMIKDVNGLADFNLLLNSGVNLKCCAHNLEGAEEKNENLLIEQQDQIVIAYADNLVDDRLEVTLYDLTGNKLDLVSPDDGAFDTVEPLCPYIVTNSAIQGFVTHVNETSIVIQPSDTSPGLEDILEQMFEHYENAPAPENPIIPEEESIYAVRSEDGNWYRGRVTGFDDDKATVVYLDYGNSEEVPFCNLRELEQAYYMWSTFAILVNVSVPTADLQDQEVSAIIYFGDNGWEGDVQVLETPFANAEEVPAEAEEQTTESSVLLTEAPIDPSQEVSEISNVQPDDSTEAAQVTEESGSSGIEIEKVDSCGTSVILSHIDSPSDFYIQLVDSLDAIDELQVKLQEKIEDMAPLESASVGGLCAAPYSVNQEWYRSQILDADDDITTVRFIDYGNTDVIDNNTTRIKTLPSELLSLEEYATRCRLKIKPKEEEWSKAATDRFEELTAVDNIKVEFIDQDEKTNYVELYSDGENVKDLMIQENLAVLDDVVLEGKLTGFVSHINSPSEFWVQLESCCAELEWIAEQLSNAGTFPDLEDFTPGALCAAMFPDDEMWYRARILSNTVAGLEVLFIDYGNSCVCLNLKQLPEHLVMAQPLAQKCSLQKPDGLLNWSSEAAEKFSELSADGETIFTVKKLTTGETSIVELLVGGEDVSNKLLPSTDNGYVTDVESLDSFSVSKEGDDSSGEKCKLDKIPGMDYNQESINKFVEITNEGKTRFEVEFLPENTVRLYLDGNDVRNILKNILAEANPTSCTSREEIEESISENQNKVDINVSLTSNENTTEEADSETKCDNVQNDINDCSTENEPNESRGDICDNEVEETTENLEVDDHEGVKKNLDQNLDNDCEKQTLPNLEYTHDTIEEKVKVDNSEIEEGPATIKSNVEISAESQSPDLQHSILEVNSEIIENSEKEISKKISSDSECSDQCLQHEVSEPVGTEISPYEDDNKEEKTQSNDETLSDPCIKEYLQDEVSNTVDTVLSQCENSNREEKILSYDEILSNPCLDQDLQNEVSTPVDTVISQCEDDNREEETQSNDKILSDSCIEQSVRNEVSNIVDTVISQCEDGNKEKKIHNNDDITNDTKSDNVEEVVQHLETLPTEKETHNEVCENNELITTPNVGCISDNEETKIISETTGSTENEHVDETSQQTTVNLKKTKDEAKIEFHEKIVESFPAPTTSESVGENSPSKESQ